MVGAVMFVTGSRLQAQEPIVITFYDDRDAFNAAVSEQTLIDFEGLVADDAFRLFIGEVADFSFSICLDTMLFCPNDDSRNKVRFLDGSDLDQGAAEIGVAGKDAQVVGSPFDSVIVFSNRGNPLTTNVTSEI